MTQAECPRGAVHCLIQHCPRGATTPAMPFAGNWPACRRHPSYVDRSTAIQSSRSGH
ncbi:hypothetical protein ACFFX0_01425 [Citricoccus parietis]|uniref:Uncharacterized protein n=1 Tax=Citricoccus parietis TaxID=592307 RepID=A0ABV5FTH2_9MICC